MNLEQLNEAIDSLVIAPGIMIKEPLAKVGNPLANCRYHDVADIERAIRPGKNRPTVRRECFRSRE